MSSSVYIPVASGGGGGGFSPPDNTYVGNLSYTVPSGKYALAKPLGLFCSINGVDVTKSNISFTYPSAGQFKIFNIADSDQWSTTVARTSGAQSITLYGAAFSNLGINGYIVLGGGSASFTYRSYDQVVSTGNISGTVLPDFKFLIFYSGTSGTSSISVDKFNLCKHDFWIKSGDVLQGQWQVSEYTI